MAKSKAHVQSGTVVAEGGIGVVTVGADNGKPVLLVTHGVRLLPFSTGEHETVRAELSPKEAREIAALLTLYANKAESS